MTTTYIFAGPSIPTEGNLPSDIRSVLHPPVRRGDVYRAARAGAKLIGIVDGYFAFEPAVSHKEILWALCQGVVVVGASSLGAIRAVELHPFGMRGVGSIFRAYARGRIWGDDEVALLHAPSDLGYQPLTVPLVNVRATLHAGLRRGAMKRTTALTILNVAKEVFFAERTFEAMRTRVRARGLNCRAVEEGQDWIESNYVDAKADDAAALIRYVHKARIPHRQQASFTFHDTEPFAAMRASIDNPFLIQFQ